MFGWFPADWSSMSGVAGNGHTGRQISRRREVGHFVIWRWFEAFPLGHRVVSDCFRDVDSHLQ